MNDPSRLMVGCGMFQIATWILTLCRKNNIPVADNRRSEPVFGEFTTDNGVLLKYENGLPSSFWSPWGLWQFMKPIYDSSILPISLVQENVSIQLIHPKPAPDPEEYSLQLVRSIPKSQWRFPIPNEYNSSKSELENIEEWRLNQLFISNIFIYSSQFRPFPLSLRNEE
jgi:hypothetical protein